ncbi:hypothetical protein [Oceanicella actignis]|uniref:Phosphodiester glycosidase domain-containing protein n=1 Tax=Oceanicella actignis TaxID=1189325 RepID=A0A1M7S1C7_9RHOB|nr:hypothetical protein [Oceanicella actignis]TYO90131.1 hypothetical protein LY05_01331 [Oceanicella actignis]SES92256.1 hypothetical protein SAMN04488119_10296 [Oceanicella actignis]SHN52256.1 hypothetical protein SAMN05216200_101422 [Oceanicella actignis]
MSRARRALGLAAALALRAAAAAAGCAPAPEAEPPARIEFFACPGAYEAQLLLLPEDADLLGRPPPGAVEAAGAYTATDRRAGGKPKPVGVFIRKGRRVSLELARMDGLALIGADGALRIAQVRAVPLGGRVHDLSTLAGRVAFARAAEGAGASAMQSHLLIREGALDLRPAEDAPRARRRILFQRADGAVGLWNSGAPLTLHEAALALAAQAAPRMALNLDAGSHDYCLAAEPGGAVRICGAVGPEAAGRLSNALRLAPARP